MTAAPAPPGAPESGWNAWEPRLRALCDGIGEATRSALAREDVDASSRPVGEGVGDVTYGLDLPSEEWIRGWSREVARGTPLSILTEDAGWRHLGPPDPDRELDGFDHGGPRIVVDPVDGTRNLMADLRSAWTVVGFALRGVRVTHNRA